MYAYTGILLSCKKEWKIPFAATCMDLEIIILSKPDRESKYISYMWNLKDNTNGLIYKLETDSQI